MKYNMLRFNKLQEKHINPCYEIPHSEKRAMDETIGRTNLHTKTHLC